MANNSLNNRFFTNTYVTGSGRHNYLRMDHLEDPLFTSFTLDIDFISSPLFYTINYSDYGYPNVEGMGDRIETALKQMYGENISVDEGYDILPQLSANILDGNKLGFGLQQNVYMDMPLYGAAEYIYMVDKRNGSADQNDVRYDNNGFVDSGVNQNGMNGFKLGDSVKSVVSESDKAWAERQVKQNQEQISVCDDIMNDPSVKNEHKQNESEMNAAMLECNQNNKATVDGKEYNESQLQQIVKDLKEKEDTFEQFKREIVDWANNEISQYQNRVTSTYMSNKCVQKIVTYDDIGICENSKADTYGYELAKIYGSDFRKAQLFGDDTSYVNKVGKIHEELKTFLSISNNEDRVNIIQKKVIDKFGDKLEYFDLYKKGNSSFTGNIEAIALKTPPDWLMQTIVGIPRFIEPSKEILNKSKNLMAYQCDLETSFSGFESNTITQMENEKAKYEAALDNLRTGLYGFENGKPCDMSNASPDSPYGRYLEAKEKYENDEYSQAEKSKSLAQSGVNEMSGMLSNDDIQNDNTPDSGYIQNSAQPVQINRNSSLVVSQTVLDMLGFISGMKRMTLDYPYIIQGISGLDTAYNKHYGIKDPYLGSGDDKITLTCLESLDLRVSSMFNRYFNAVYDRQYRRERVPINLRRFNCSIYVHDVRNFVAISRLNSDGSYKTSYNRIVELTDMYYSVIEFRFYDCEIVPEETGNIFDNISNEAPSEMKKTNFTFTYGNCVVNFVPQSEVVAHNSK